MFRCVEAAICIFRNTYVFFMELIDGLNSVSLLHSHINDNLHLPIDSSDLLRWGCVQCVSAPDEATCIFDQRIIMVNKTKAFQKPESISSYSE